MSRGKRYETTEKQLNYQKVVAVVIAIAVVIMFIFIIRSAFKERQNIHKEYEYFTVYSENKWGVINQEGEIVIQPSYQEMIIIPDKTKDVFICMYNVNEETGEYKTKVINSQNEEIFTNYEKVEAIENIDKNENVWYEEGILRTENNQKYGLIDLGGKEILPCEYDSIKALQGIENSLLIQKDEKVGIANSKGSIIIEPNYKEIKNLGDTYKEGYITINDENKYGVVSTTKKQALDNKYDDIEQVYLDNYYLVKQSGVKRVINTSGEIILEGNFDDITSNTSKGFIFKKGDLYGEISTEGDTVIEPKYQYLEETEPNIFIAKQDDKYGIIDELEEVKIPFEYTGIKYNEKANLFIAETSEYKTALIDKDFNIKVIGILSEINTEKEYIRMRVDDQYKYYNLKGEEKENTEILKDNTIFLSKKDGKYGYVDKKGNAITEFIYDDATEQNEYGFAGIKINGLWGSIDKNGKEVIEPKYNLENNLKIDFIGKWHLGEDLNMNYYCEK